MLRWPGSQVCVKVCLGLLSVEAFLGFDRHRVFDKRQRLEDVGGFDGSNDAKSFDVTFGLAAIARGSLAPAEAATLRGQTGWTATLSAGRFGRIGMHFLKNRQYQSHSESSTLDGDDTQALEFLAFLVSAAPPHAVFFGRSSRPLFRIYSDASHTEGVRTRLGWVLMTDKATTPVGYWYDIPASLLRDWALAHPIMAAESFAILTAIWQHRDLLTKGNVISLKDNEAAARAVIKGDSRLEVVGAMAMCVQLLLIRCNIAVWFEWVDSDSNLADGLSRDGAEDSWTLKQDWELHEF